MCLVWCDFVDAALPCWLGHVGLGVTIEVTNNSIPPVCDLALGLYPLSLRMVFPFWPEDRRAPFWRIYIVTFY